MMTGKNVCAAAMVSVLATACAIDDTGEQPIEELETSEVESEIFGGTATMARPELGRLNINGSTCSATLIDARHFVTAAHCFNYASFKRPTNTTFTIERANGDYEYDVERVFSQGGQLGADDLAVGRLAVAVPSSVAIPASIGVLQPLNTWLTTMGYGCTDTQAAGTKRYREYFFTGGSSRTLCPGDSGGSVFSGQLTQNGPIVRIHSGSVRNPSGLALYDIHADPVRFRNELLTLAGGMETTGVCYRAHVAGVGWQATRCNGAVAGTVGQGRSLEAVQIWSARPGVRVCYQAHVEGVGWMSEVCDGELGGTVRQGRSLEAVRIRISGSTGTEVVYKAHVQNIGWQSQVRNNQIAGTTGAGLAMEALTVALD
jgi:hypothetical protein